LLERFDGEVGKPLVAGCVEEAERQGTALDSSGHAFERDAGILKRLGHQHAAHISRRKTILVLGGQDAEIQESNDELGLHPSSLSGIVA
jgi:hypothetical protein